MNATIRNLAVGGSREVPWDVDVFRFGRGVPWARFADQTRHPFLLPFHGTGSAAVQLSWLAEELVAAGFVVAAVERNGLSTRDPRIRAFCAMAPALVLVLDAESLQSVAVPVRAVLGEEDVLAPVDPTAVVLNGFGPGVSVDVLPGVSHSSFLAPCTLRGRLFVRPLCADGETDRMAVHTSATKDSVRFSVERLAASEPS